MYSAPLVYIVILNYNGARFLKQFLPILQTTNYPNYKIIVGDNASTDSSLDLLKRDFPQVICIELEENFGFAQGYNQTLQRVKDELANPDYYVLLNSDVEVCPNWLQPLVQAMEADAELGICQPKILDFSRRDSFEYAGASGGFMDLLFYSFCRGRLFTHIEKDWGQYEQTREIFWASGAALIIRSQLFHQLGGFNPYFFAHQEEIDLCWRAQLRGHKIRAIPQSVVYHIGGGTLSYNSPRKIYLNHRNTLVMIANNLPFGAHYWRILLRIALEGIGLAIFYLLSGRAVLPIWQAHWHFLKWYVRERKQTPAIYRSNNIVQKSKLSGIYRGIFILDYFFLGKRHFSQLNKQRIS